MRLAALAVCFLLLAATAVAHAQRRPSSGDGGNWIQGADYNDRFGAPASAPRSPTRAFRIKFARTGYDFYYRSKQLCGFWLGEEVRTGTTTHEQFYGKIGGVTGPVRNGRFRWRGSRPLVSPKGARERIVIEGRRTGPKTATVKFTLSVGQCTKVFRVKLSPKPMPEPPARPPLREPKTSWDAERTVGDPASGSYMKESVEFFRKVRTDRPYWSATLRLIRFCQPPRGDPNTGLYDIEVTATWFKRFGETQVNAGGADEVVAPGTVTLEFTLNGNRLHGTVSWNIQFEHSCEGSYSDSWQFVAN